MLILIEGNEGTGKTTLINQISKHLPCVTVKYAKEVKDTCKLFTTLIPLKKLILFDRSFVTDMVYRMWDHKPGQMKLSQIGDLLDYANDIKIIWCCNGNGWKNAQTRGEDFICTENDYKIIDNNFFRVITLIESFTNVPVLHYDYEYNDIEDVINFINGGHHVD